MTAVKISCDGCGAFERATARWTAFHYQGETNVDLGHACPVCLDHCLRLFKLIGVRFAFLGEWRDKVGIQRDHVEVYRTNYGGGDG